MKVLHIIVSLEVGGAELMLKRLIEYSKNEVDKCHTVISLTSIGELGTYLKSIGIEVHELKMQSILDIPITFFRLVDIVRNIKPDIVQTWMYHADLLGGIASRFAGIRNIVWNVRNTGIPQSRLSRTGLVITICAALSRIIPKKIVCCAHAGLNSHAKLRYDSKRMLVIPNGFDNDTWSIPTQTRAEIRETFNLPDGTFIVGIVGRFDPLKGYDVFVEAAGIMLEQCQRPVIFLMIGRNVTNNNSDLRALIESKGRGAKFRLMGERKDISNIMYALDVYCLSSKSEGFPNVVAEAMLMQTPCVVTDVGDAKRIVGSLGKVVPSNNASELANALLEMERLDTHELRKIGRASREKILETYNIEVIAQQYSRLYEAVIKNELS